MEFPASHAPGTPSVPGPRPLSGAVHPVQRGPGSFSIDNFRRHLIVKRGLKPVTAKRNIERLLYAIRKGGFDIASFTRDAALAEEAGLFYLEKRLGEATVFVYNNDTKWMNALADFCGWNGVHFDARREPPPVPRTLDADQVRHLVSFQYQGSRTINRFRRALIQFDTIVGARPSEVAAMDFNDLDPQRSRVFIRHPAKGGRQRWLPVPRHLWNRNRPFGAYLANRQLDPSDASALWVTGIGRSGEADPRRVDSDSLRNVLADITRETGIKVTFNILRHTVGTELLRRTGNLRLVQYWLGHSSITSTVVYAEVGEHSFEGMPTPPDYYQRVKPR